MKVKCINKKCNHIWDYQGGSNNYISCPLCLYRFKLQRAIDNIVNYVNIHNNIVHNIPTTKKFFLNLDKLTPEMFNLDNEKIEEVEEVQEQESVVRILSPSLPAQIQRALNEKEQEQNNPFLNPPKEKPNFEIKIIPYDPIKHLEHMKNYYF